MGSFYTNIILYYSHQGSLIIRKKWVLDKGLQHIVFFVLLFFVFLLVKQKATAESLSLHFKNKFGTRFQPFHHLVLLLVVK